MSADRCAFSGAVRVAVGREAIGISSTLAGMQPEGPRFRRPRHVVACCGRRALFLGDDVGVSFRSVDHPAGGVIETVVSNTSEGAWPFAALLDERFGTR